ncbi:hypothetical protein HRE53_30335 (plasmid) [Acaryochloris sp. 'Moss Beach']|uniref:hypothetical protein n=1 Tax=Acaryochloris sp. 'Moss Beach' TaxID=2740837 RepID=UPI001F41D42D|nr:hypothetical protein [Acaryochloris sp. 'Moss Beach']UJB72899.1 hypothetical protein HRE53_30335 [Acaryochloris sp. 'Moss Beach']
MISMPIDISKIIIAASIGKAKDILTNCEYMLGKWIISSAILLAVEKYNIPEHINNAVFINLNEIFSNIIIDPIEYLYFISEIIVFIALDFIDFPLYS